MKRKIMIILLLFAGSLSFVETNPMFRLRGLQQRLKSYFTKKHIRPTTQKTRIFFTQQLFRKLSHAKNITAAIIFGAGVPFLPWFLGTIGIFGSWPGKEKFAEWAELRKRRLDRIDQMKKEKNEERERKKSTYKNK